MNKALAGSITGLLIATGLPAVWGASAKPDLIQSALANPPAKKAPGSQFKVFDTVKNKGAVKAGRSVTKYFLSLDKRKSAGDIRLTGKRSVKALAPNKTSAGNKNVTIPASTPEATYYLIACADAKSKVKEKSEGNNCRASTGKLSTKTIPPAAPEITMSDPSSPSPDPNPTLSGTAEAGSTVTLYESFDCTGSPEASGPASQFASPGFTVSVPNETTTAYTATATDEDNNVSACSPTFFYRMDSLWETEPNNTFSAAETLSQNGRSGSINPVADSDFYSFTVPPGGSVTLETFNDPGGTCSDPVVGSEDTTLTLYAGDGTTVLQEDDNGGAGLCSLVDRNHLAGTYYVSVTKAGGVGETIPEYWLQMTLGPAPGESEPNDAFGQANAIPAQFISGGLAPDGDKDYYSIMVPQGGYIQARTFDSSGTSCVGTDTTIRLYAPDGITEFGSNDNDASPDSCSTIDGHPITGGDSFAQDLAAGTYFVRVEETGNDSTTNYMLSLIAAQEVEPNETVAHASVFSKTTLLTGVTAAIQPVGDKDLYAVHVPAGADLVAETFDGTGTACDEIDTFIKLTAPDGTSVLGSDDNIGINNCSKIDGSTGGPHGFARNLPAGTYYLSVEESGNDGVIDTYVVKISVLISSEVEPNNSTADADARAADVQSKLIQTDESFTGSISPVADNDYFNLSLPSAQVVRFESFDASGHDCIGGMTTNVTLLNSAGTVLKSDAGLGGILGCGALVTEAPSGASYIRINESGNNASVGAYVLETDVLAPVSPETEPNETKEQANALAGTSLVVPGDHLTTTDSDFYSVSVPTSGMSIRAEIIEGTGNPETCESNEVDSHVTLYDSLGTELAQDDDDGRGFCSLIDGTGSSATRMDAGAFDLATGTYFIKVKASDLGTTTGKLFDYRMALTIR